MKKDELIGLGFVVGIAAMILGVALAAVAPKPVDCTAKERAVATAEAAVPSINYMDPSREPQRRAAKAKVELEKLSLDTCKASQEKASRNPLSALRDLAKPMMFIGGASMLAALGFVLAERKPQPQPQPQPQQPQPAPVYDYPEEATEDWLNTEPTPEPEPTVTTEDRPRSGWGRSVNFGD